MYNTTKNYKSDERLQILSVNDLKTFRTLTLLLQNT